MNSLPNLLIGKTVAELRRHPDFVDTLIPDPEQVGDESYIEMTELGMSFVFPDGETVSSVHLYADGRDGYSQFRGVLPFGLSFQKSRSEIRVLLGEPVEADDGGVLPIIGAYNPFDLFLLDDQRIHVEYVNDLTSVSLITLGD
ncbi:MAG: hypothetical protein P4L53_12445 [Candidatus Obscuribacterales bacterium]|nr:hypothetical protein [Candidatus Obscuribacterales bacterium]